jgi:hypothetical protein
MALDMAISIAQTKQACSDLIEQAKKMLEGDNTATDPQYLTHFKRFELMLSHGTLLGSVRTLLQCWQLGRTMVLIVPCSSIAFGRVASEGAFHPSRATSVKHSRP